MPGIIDKVLNKIEGNPASAPRSGSVSSKDTASTTGSAYDGHPSGPGAGTGTGFTGKAERGVAREGDDLALREGTGPGTTGHGGAAANTTDGANGASGFNRNATSGPNGSNGPSGVGVGMTDASGTRGVHGTGTHGHHFAGVDGEEHSFGHQPKEGEAVPDRLDAGAQNVHHDTFHLGHKTHERVLHPEVEEVSREREHERHVHHVQHHVQPVQHREEMDEVHQQRGVPVTRIHEKHVNEDEGDREAFLGLGQKHQDRVEHLPAQRQVVDAGETVNETVHHHVHNVIQPIVQKETIAPTRIHTTVPLHHVVHEAPIVHSSISHEPMARDDFLAQGGKLGEGLTHQAAGDRLLGGDCERNVEGDGENMLSKMRLGGAGSHTHGNAASPATGSDATA
ncbi:hypothetical protein CALCODRAFT_495073 [Calocera cornea HHB12733]|uniref:Allergen n=1 Tax=Calocera cornea HHB12733 TaxID=1353952 RepID=A0A165GQE2_9BASI|nr:hypothetical protein CALCODRAFT_495073 [Calocera cornea HHB12733]